MADKKKEPAKYKNVGFKGDPETNKKYIYSVLLKDGFTHEAATAVVANVLVETNQLKNVEEIAVNNNGQRGLGILQWSGVRANEFRDWVEVNGKDIRDIKDNVEYLLLEAKKKSKHHWTGFKSPVKGDDSWIKMGYDKFKKLTNIDVATEAFMRGYLRPEEAKSHLDVRQQQATKYNKVFNGEPYEESENATKSMDDIMKQQMDVNRTLTEANEKASKAIETIDMGDSSVSRADLDKLHLAATKMAINERIDGDMNDPYNRVAKLAYGRKSELLGKPNLGSAPELGSAPSLGERPNINYENINTDITKETDNIAMNPSTEADQILAMGGFLQPNGRRTKFTREEDVIAQNNTSS